MQLTYASPVTGPVFCGNHHHQSERVACRVPAGHDGDCVLTTPDPHPLEMLCGLHEWTVPNRPRLIDLVLLLLEHPPKEGEVTCVKT